MTKRSISVSGKQDWNINFELSDNTPWRNTDFKPVEEMIDDIVEYHARWEEANEDGKLESTAKKFGESLKVDFIQHINNAEDTGTQIPEETRRILMEKDENISQTRPKTEREIETINIGKAYDHLKSLLDSTSKQNSQEDFYGDEPIPKYTSFQLLGVFDEKETIKETHSILMHDLPKGNRGKYSTNERFTKRLDGSKHSYPKFETEEEASETIQRLIDDFNPLIEKVKNEENEKEQLKLLFKCASTFFFLFLEIHPYGDGNGRLGRLLCNYILNVFNPFPTPVFNIYSSTKKEDYTEAIIKAQETRCPSDLTVMIIECSWKGWENFLNKVIPSESDAVAITD